MSGPSSGTAALGTAVRAFLLAAWVAPLAAQPPAAVKTSATHPEFTSASAEARQALSKGLEDFAYIFTARAASQFAGALAADSTFGLARVFYAAVAPGLDQARREAEATRGLVDAATRGSVAELLLAAAGREAVANRPTAAQLFRVLADMYPEEPLFATWAASNPGGAQTAAATADAFRDVTRRFPNYGPAYNTLAYALIATGDTAGALAAAKRQVELAPDQPNAQDTYAEILQWNGRLDEAASAYGEATRVAPTFSEAYVGLAEVRQLQRRNADARAALADALRNAQSIDDSLRYMLYGAEASVFDNDMPAAVRQLSAVAQLAEQRQLTDRAALAHANLAVVAALTNDRPGIIRHAADVVRLGKPDNPQLGRTIVAAYIAAGMTDTLRAIVARVDTAPIARAYVALTEGRTGDALTSLALADSTAPLVQELSAEVHAKMKHADVARAARQRLLDRRDQVYFNTADLRAAVALRRAASLKP
jgi:tetratricopeptide (TPR) repeat protein